MLDTTRRQLLTATAGVGGIGLFAGCIGSDAGADGAPTTGSTDRGTTAQASFFVFGDITQRIAGDAATAELLVPVGQHGHGWEPGPNVRTSIYEADLFVHGMEGFQPWVDTVVRDLSADGTEVTTLDIGRAIDLLDAGGDGAHTDGEHTDGEQDHGSADPHFWMDPLRVKEAAATARESLIDADPDNADTYADNTARLRAELDALHGRAESIVADASTETILVAGHNSVRYFGDRYGINVESLTGVSPDDMPTPRDIERAQSIIDEHDLQYVCADPLESRRAADQLVAETDVEDVLDLTAMPGVTETWETRDWGYVDVMENVNLPTLERALNA